MAILKGKLMEIRNSQLKKKKSSTRTKLLFECFAKVCYSSHTNKISDEIQKYTNLVSLKKLVLKNEKDTLEKQLKHSELKYYVSEIKIENQSS